MRSFKKKTLALVLASVVTVVGAFGAENYKNSLLGLSFEGTPDSAAVNMVVQTKTQYSGSVTPIRKDKNTYVLMLPEIDSQISETDLSKVSGYIESVNVRTMPYSNSSNGYTKVTVKTLDAGLKLNVSNQIFIPTEKPAEEKVLVDKKNTSVAKETSNSPVKKQETNTSSQRKMSSSRVSTNPYDKEEVLTKSKQEKEKIAEPVKTVQLEEDDIINDYRQEEEQATFNYAFLLALLVVLLSVYFYMRAKDKMSEVTGERFTFGEEESNETDDLKKIKKTIKKIDTAYSKTAVPKVENIKNKLPNINQELVKNEEVLDLDEIFKNQQKKENDLEQENFALEEFLSGFSFDENLYKNEELVEPDLGYDEIFYERVLEKDNLKFSQNEINMMNQLLLLEIKDVEKLMIKKEQKEVVEKKKNKKEILEDLVLNYSVSQNISFSSEDISALNKLVNVELESDFVTDLRTNRQRTVEMEAQMLLRDAELKKPSEVKILNVKNLLPNLSEALKSFGNRRIESNYKADAVYFSEGYDVKILSVSDELKELSQQKEAEKNINESLQESKKNVSSAMKIVEKINEKKDMVKEESAERMPKKVQFEEVKQEEKLPIEKANCIFDGQSFIILNTISLEEGKGCHLAKNENGYVILGFIGERLFKINSYKELKNEKMQARLSEKASNGDLRYLLRVGSNKIIINVKNDSIEYVMDLC